MVRKKVKKTKKVKKANEKTAKITKKTSFHELISKYPETIEVLLSKGMHCIGCPMSTGENIEQGAIAHGIDPDALVKELNNKIGK